MSEKRHTFYVSPEGDDRWSGTRPEPAPDGSDGPFRTPARALDAIRSLRAAGGPAGPVTVYLRGGTYRLDQPLRFTPADSGTAAAPISFAAFPGERPVLSGGRPITGWSRRSDGLCVATLPDVAAGGWYFRLLRVGRSWAVRARYPNADPAQPVTGVWLFVPAGLPDARDRIVLNLEAFPAWQDWTGAEVHIFPAWGWVNAILTVTGVDPAERTLHVACEQDIRPGNRFFIANVREALDSPGEWYLDRQRGELLYWPTDPAFPAVEVVAPAVDRLLVLEGEGDRFVEHLRFSGLTFTDTDYTAPGGYYTPADAAVWLSRARRVAIEDCTFESLGGYAVRLDQHSHDNAIVGNRMAGLGQGGIVMLGDAASQPYDNLIAANEMEDLGLVYKHVAGVYVTTGRGNRIVHNRIRRVPRYGISLKSYSATAYSHQNVVEFNDLVDTNLETNDTGAIETLGRDQRPTGNVIRFNRIHNVVGVGTRPDGTFLTPHFTWGIYLDDYSSGTTVYGNIVSGTVLGALCIHGGKENRIENNIFLDGAERQITLQPRDDFMQENHFRRNIVVFRKPEAVLWYSWARTWRRDRIASDHNLYWHCGGLDLAATDRQITPEGTLAAWQAAGFDRHSLVADPRFADLDGGDFRLAPDSPAW
ncbi:MAG TPA: right-handed parallel beta-helix repeat-containing protein, partial [Limnochordia bacterium]